MEVKLSEKKFIFEPKTRQKPQKTAQNNSDKNTLN